MDDRKESGRKKAAFRVVDGNKGKIPVPKTVQIPREAMTGKKRGDKKAGLREAERAKKSRPKNRKKGELLSLCLGFLLTLLAFSAGMGAGWYRWGRKVDTVQDLSAIQVPEWIEQNFIRKNIYSRPAVSRYVINDIVIHYVANPNTSAARNRNYFDSLADQTGDDGQSASAHFVIGLDGEIIQCIPIREIAYTSNFRNMDTVSIECCHPDETGKFTEATYQSLVKLTAWLCDEIGIGRDRVIRHYDITEKNCPKYFVDNENAWNTFLSDVKDYKEDTSNFAEK